ncbi:MAG: DNA polymerase III subunit beta [Bacillota bacterium]
MKIKINKQNFYEGIQTVKKAVSSKSNLPILSGILLETEDKKLKLVGTDLELGIECKVEANIINEGAVVLPANHLANIIRELPNEELVLNTNQKDNRTEITCDLSQFKINSSPADEFPLLPEVESNTECTLPQEEFKKIINRTKFATSNDESRPFLTGGLLLLDEQDLKMVATDSYRLAYSEYKLNQKFSTKKAIIPSKTLNELSKLLNSEEDIKFIITDNQILFEFSGITIISRLIEGQFPNYNQVIPDKENTIVKINKEELLNAAKRASLVAKNDSNIIKTEFVDNRLIIQSNAPEVGQAYEEVTTNQQGENTKISFNASYLIDVLKVLDEEEVLLKLSGELSPGIIKEANSNDYLHVIMPVRSN